MNQKLQISILILIIVIVGTVGFGYYKLTRVQNAKYLDGAGRPPAKIPQSITDKNDLYWQNDAANWKTYRSEKYGFEIQYPADWKLSEDSDFVGFRSPEWDKEPKLEGSTVTISVSRGITKEEALLNSGFETKEEAVREKDEPLGGFGNEKYFATGSSAGPATPAKETTVNGLPAIVAEVPTRLYGAEGYAGASEGKQVLIMGNNVYATIRIESSFYEVFDKMISTFEFLK